MESLEPSPAETHACDSLVLDFTGITKLNPPHERVPQLPQGGAPRGVPGVRIAARSGPFEMQDTYPDAPLLLARANAGCKLCKLLRQPILDKIRSELGVWARDQISDSIEFTINGARWIAGGEERDSRVQPRISTASTKVSTLEIGFRMSGFADREKWPEGSSFTSACFFRVQAGKGDPIATKFCLNSAWERDETSYSLPGSEAFMKECIESCVEAEPGSDHWYKCRLTDPAPLPSRLLDVDDPSLGIEHCRLVETEKETCGRYVALSYVWGSAPKFLTTTTSVYDEHKRGINMDSLPQAFQDAIRVTRMLGVRYIWIDALCILQDSLEDWQAETADMGNIYKHAYVTIAATQTASADDGFLSRKALYPTFKSSTSLEVPVVGMPDTEPGSKCRLVLAPEPDIDTRIRIRQEDLEETTWNTRGWTLQERHLSRRILHFGKNMLHFECQSVYRNEDGYDRDPSVNPIPSISLVHTASTQNTPLPPLDISEARSYPWVRYDLWYAYVVRYVRRGLTRDSDRLPAISGFAREASLHPTDLSGSEAPCPGRYIAGLWTGDLAVGLLWVPTATRTAASAYRAPSWSWAAEDGPVHWYHYPSSPTSVLRKTIDDDAYHARHPESAVELVDAAVDLAGEDPFGAVHGGRLVLKGQVYPVTLGAPYAASNAKNNDTLFGEFYTVSNRRNNDVPFGEPDAASSGRNDDIPYETLFADVYEGQHNVAVAQLDTRIDNIDSTDRIFLYMPTIRWNRRRAHNPWLVPDVPARYWKWHSPGWMPTGLLLECLDPAALLCRRVGVFVLQPDHMHRFTARGMLRSFEQDGYKTVRDEYEELRRMFFRYARCPEELENPQTSVELVRNLPWPRELRRLRELYSLVKDIELEERYGKNRPEDMRDVGESVITII